MSSAGRRLAAAAAVVAVTVALPAAAEEGWYAGIGVGATRADVTNTLFVSGATASSRSQDDEDTGYKLLAGYRFGRHFAIEGGYVNLGEASTRLDVTAPVVGSLSGRAKSDGWLVDAVGIVPLGSEFSLLGKLGALYSTTKTELSTSGAVVLSPGAPAHRERSEWNLAYGLGLQYDLGKSLALRAEWERFQKVGNTGCSDCTGEADVDLYSLGLNFKF